MVEPWKSSTKRKLPNRLQFIILREKRATLFKENIGAHGKVFRPLNNAVHIPTHGFENLIFN
jgi:hypothetical protein